MNESREGALVGRTIAGKFLIESFIGEGAMGAVYKARQIALEKTVALKVLHADRARDTMSAALFEREARAASKLDHPNSIRVVDFGQEPDGLLYIAMEYFAGRDLQRVLAEDGPLSPYRIADILSQALAAIAVAHEMGIVHRDLKPENILVRQGHDDEGAPHDVVKVCDFGIAKFTGANEGSLARSSRHLTEGLLFGTPHYMSPEQTQGGSLDARTDLYSMGIILYQMLTSRVPFDGKTLVDVAIKHVHEDPVPPSQVSCSADARLEAICLKAMRKRKEERFQSARDMRGELRAVMSAPPSTPTLPRAPISRDAPTLPPPQSQRRTSNVTPTATSFAPGRTRHRAGLSAVVLAVVFATTAVLLRTRAPHSDVGIAAPPLPSPIVSPVSLEPRAGATAESAVIPDVPSSRTAPAPPSATHSREWAKATTHATTKSGSTASPANPADGETTQSGEARPHGRQSEPRERPFGSSTLLATATETATASVPPVEASPVIPAPPSAPTMTAALPPRPFDASRGRVTWSVGAVGGGATAGDVRRSFSRVSTAWDACYQEALRTGGRRVEGSGLLHVATDEEGNVVQATVTGFALPAAQTCIATAARVRIAGVDTGSAWADVKLVFRAEAPE